MSKLKSPRPKALDDSENLLYTRWIVFQSSPLFNLDRSKLSRYGRILSKKLNELKHINKIHKAVFYNCLELKNGVDGKNGLKVTVSSEDGKCLYLGYFMNWNSVGDTEEECENLPIMLVQEANAATICRVNNILCEIFDCDIQRIQINFKNIVTTFALFVHYSDRTDKRNIRLKYNFPSEKTTDVVSVEFPLHSTFSILEIQLNKFADHDIEEPFYEKLMNHIGQLYQLDLFKMNLISVSMPTASITIDGVIKVNCKDLLSPILILLQSIIMKITDEDGNNSPTPSISTIE